MIARRLRTMKGPLAASQRDARNCRRASRCDAAEDSMRTLNSRVATRRTAVTLIELLVTIAIISILATALLGVAAVAGNTAREARTKTMITRLHTLLMEHFDTYKTRRVRLNQNLRNAIADNSSFNGTQRGQALAEARLYALREMMLTEMPDRWTDVLLNNVSGSPLNTIYLENRTALSQAYLRKYIQIVAVTNKLTGVTNTALEIADNQGAECLYMTIMLATGDGEARSLFSENNIGDVDGDGAPEFLDGWGRPISFLRWAPGFESEIQLNFESLNAMSPMEANLAVASDHDPFDIFRVDLVAFRLVPLIYSDGQDEENGFVDPGSSYKPWLKITSLINWNSFSSWGNNFPYFPLNLRITPYLEITTGKYLGSDNDQSASTDNIHNHLLGTR